ncbi:hypothetical protein EJB05_18702 [Eragrostis curvula]|uniref:Uncharacterized protein n=1 Tax=Eragrostis curvula TaxID=38414 RepID=A0A5J9VMR0_9POAL|nr:hypothetical protein EJB05_18702 [Eragrostis curvula]
MALRFLFRNISSRISRSRCLPGAHASASARDAAPVASRASEGPIGTLAKFSHGAAAHPSTVVSKNRGIHAYTARCFNSFPESKTNSPTTKMPSVTHRTEPAFVGPISSTSRHIKGSVSCETEKAARGTEMEAKKSLKAKMEAEKKAYDDAFKDWASQLVKRTTAFNRNVSAIMLVWTLIVVYWVSCFGSPRGAEGGKSKANGIANEAVGDNVP